MIILYASAAYPNGWGRGPQNISNPGPALTVVQGDTVMFHLFSQDGATHSLVIDLDGSNSKTPADWVSDEFNSSGSSFFTANAPGSFTYFCGTHDLSMAWGTIRVTPASAGSDNTLVVVGGGILLVALVGAVVYRWRHVPVPRKALPKNQSSRNRRNARGKHAVRTRHRS
jgi:hypothetical protein